MSEPVRRVSRSALRGSGGRMRLMALLGWRMMFHDRAKLIGTLLGVIFAAVLVNQQLGVLMGLLQKNTMFVDNAAADVWICPPSTEQFQPGARISIYTLQQARVMDGVAWAEPLLVGGSTMRLPSGGGEAVTLVGTRAPRFAGGPWNLVAGDARSITQADTLIFEDSQRRDLGGVNLGSVRELGGHRVIAGGFTWGLGPFGPPYAFAEFDTAREILRVGPDETDFVLVGVRGDARATDVARRLQLLLPDTRVMTREEYSSTIVRALLRDQLGISFATSTFFGVIVGFVIVALSMFSAVVDNIREFGTLKAMGATTFDLAKLLFVQAVAYASIGCAFGLFLVTRMAEGIRSANLVLVLPWWMFAGTFGFMVLLCIVASSLALLRVRSVEPGMVFR
ncbi:MAG: FtsX-like permease family protein [Deltaproteobacteria bacterium]|nr:FtsX-like permease family protein [Deltaproteobacteria bacterium]